jgi:hypothetical protein
MDSVVVVSRLRAGLAGVQIPTETQDDSLLRKAIFFSSEKQYFSLLRNVQTGSGIHPAYYSTGTRGCFPGVKRPRSEVNLVPRLRMSGAIPPLIHAFME